MKIRVLISADAEWEAVKSLYPGSSIAYFPFGETLNLSLSTPALSNVAYWNLKLLHSGWGKISSAAAMQYVIDHDSPDLFVNLGTCGGFAGSVHQGEVLLVETTFVYDIVELMADAEISTHFASRLDLSWLPEPHPYSARRAVLASADSDLLPEKIPFLRSKGAIAADWESAALAWVAQRNNVRLLILRGVSDIVSDQGSAAYHNLEVFNQRAIEIMKKLLNQLPGWLQAVQLS